MNSYTHYCAVCGESRWAWYEVKLYLCQKCKRQRNAAVDRARSGTEKIKKRHLKVNGATCSECKNRFSQLILHHIVPIALGGKTTFENTRLVCDECHRALHAETKLQNKAYRLLLNS